MLSGVPAIPRAHSDSSQRIVSPEYALLIVEERLKEQQAEGVRMPEGMPLDQPALRVLIATDRRRWPELTRRKPPGLGVSARFGH